MSFFSRSPFNADVEAATDGKQEDWQKIMDICDKARATPQTAKDCLSCILPRLRHQDPHIVLQAITLLDACVNNCGKHFHLEIASRDFENEYRKILSKSKGEVRTKLLEALKKWAEGEFSKDHQLSLIPSLVTKLRLERVQFPNEVQTKKPDKAASTAAEKEQNDLALAIELSLKDSSPRNKASSGGGGGNTYPTASLSNSNLYPTASFSNLTVSEGRKVRALYDFEAGEDGELTFKAGDIITVIDEADANWWKGENKKGEGLFPSNFVTADLSIEPEQPNRRSVQFADQVRVQKIVKEEIEIDESKMDKLLHYLHEADPSDQSRDPPEMLDLADEVNAMGPLIDTELERVDRKHAELTQLCMDLQGSLNLYHSLLREPAANHPPSQGPSYIAKPLGYPYPPQPQVNGGPGMMSGPYGAGPHGMPPQMVHPGPPPSMHGLPGPGGMPPNHFIPNLNIRHPNGMPQYGPPPGAQQQPPPGSYQMPPMGPPVPTAQPGYHDNKPLH